MTAIPSIAILYSFNDFSSSLSSLEDIPISDVPSIAAFIPTPEPPP